MKIITPIYCAILCCASPLQAFAYTDDDIAALKQQVLQLTTALQTINNKLDLMTLTQETNAQSIIMSAAPSPSTTNWADRTEIKSDLRYRYEMIDEQDDRESKGEDIRNRQRLRARVSIASNINNEVYVEVGLASGGIDATSTNQSLDNSFSTKGFNLDLAYFNWKANENINIIGGKMKLPFYRPAKSTLLWDSDLRPEGFSANWQSDRIFVNLGAFHIEEGEINHQEAYLFSAQVGTNIELGDSKLTTGFGYFNFDGLKNNNLSNLGGFNNRGNTVLNGALENDFEVFEFFGELKFKVADMNASIFGDYIVNKGVDDQAANGDNDTGYLVGFSLASGPINAKYYYENIENDATVSSFNDSDFIGGGTDGKGHVIKLSYAMSKQIKLAFTYFSTEEDGHAKGTRFTDYDRLQADVNFKF